MAQYAAEIARAYPRAGKNLAAKVEQVARRLGAHPYDLANLINFESAGRWSSSVQNPTSGATGLIQFMPATAQGLGTSTSALSKLSTVQQMDWVERYLSPYRGRIGNAADLYMAVFYPVAIGKGPSYRFPPEVEAWNPGTRTPADYVRKANQHARLPSTLDTHSWGKGLIPSSMASIMPRGKNLIRRYWWVGLLAGGLVLFLGTRRRRRRRYATPTPSSGILMRS